MVKLPEGCNSWFDVFNPVKFNRDLKALNKRVKRRAVSYTHLTLPTKA